MRSGSQFLYCTLTIFRPVGAQRPRSSERAVEIGGSGSEPGRIAELLSQYRDVPMSLADASLVALAEDRGLHQIFTLDSEFHVYRLLDRRHFTVIP